MRFIDNGKFLPSLLAKRKVIVGLAKEARVHEGKTDIDHAFEKWYEVSNLIDQFEDEYFDPSKIQWAKKVNFLYDLKGFGIGVITGIIGSAVVQYLFPDLIKIFNRKQYSPEFVQIGNSKVATAKLSQRLKESGKRKRYQLPNFHSVSRNQVAVQVAGNSFVIPKLYNKQVPDIFF